MNIITIKGKSNSGKTSAIKYAIKCILNLPDTKIQYVSYFSSNEKRFHCEKNDLLRFLDESIEKGHTSDTNIGLVVIQYKQSIIGFTTYGDSLKDIIGYYNRALAVTKDKMICFVCARHNCNDVAKEFKTVAQHINAPKAILSEKIKIHDFKEWDKENKKKGEKIVQMITETV